MRKRWKEWKPWARWLTWSAAGVILLAGAGIGILQYKLQSTSLEDIQARQAAKQNGSAPEAGAPASGAPGALKDPLAKANEFTDKPISAQDALDAAAILTQAGLSMKEMSYLTGKADAGLPVEEKQRIRDLLLSKLTPEQIQTLRSITEPYGKKLVILDKDYPIELVGVYDEAERQRIIKEIHERRQASAAKPPAASDAGGQADASAGPSAAPAGEGGGSKASGGASGSGSTGGTASGSAPSASGGASKPEPAAPPAEASKPAAPAGGSAGSSGGSSGTGSGASKAQIKSKYEGKLAAIQNGCQSQVSQLAGGIVSSIRQAKASNQQISVDQLQSKYMGPISASESSCDSQFNSVLASAQKDYKAAGYDPAELESWRSQYQSSKSQAKSQALQQIASAMK